METAADVSCFIKTRTSTHKDVNRKQTQGGI
jgi:hypothetical protein